jgi:D-alanyl-lipoteichoic acid acyltransferase DltB (MBOAT superfamily)
LPNLPKQGAINQTKPVAGPVDQIYFFFKSQRMTLRSKTFDVNFTSASLDLWGTLLQLKVGNRSEEIVIRLFKESKDDTPDICLASGLINLSQATQQSWKKFPKEVILITT